MILAILIVLAALNSFTDLKQLSIFIVAFMVFIVIPHVATLYYLIRQKKVTNWDVSNRNERVKVLSGFLIFLFIDCLIVRLFGNPFLVKLFTLYIVWFLGFYCITLKWKISGHTGVMTLAIGLLYQWYGSIVLPAVVLIPLIAWVRVRRRNHTVWQVVGGVGYSLAILLFYGIFNF